MSLRLTLVRVLVSTPALFLQFAIAEIHTPVSASSAAVDCSNASKEIAAIAMPTMSMTGNLDHDYLMKANATAAMAMKMAHIEMICGKSAAAKKAAQMAMERDQDVQQVIFEQTHVR